MVIYYFVRCNHCNLFFSKLLTSNRPRKNARKPNRFWRKRIQAEEGPLPVDRERNPILWVMRNRCTTRCIEISIQLQTHRFCRKSKSVVANWVQLMYGILYARALYSCFNWKSYFYRRNETHFDAGASEAEAPRDRHWQLNRSLESSSVDNLFVSWFDKCERWCEIVCLMPFVVHESLNRKQMMCAGGLADWRAASTACRYPDSSAATRVPFTRTNSKLHSWI